MAKKETKKPDPRKQFSTKYKDTIIPGSSLKRTEEDLIQTGSLKLNLMLRGGFRTGTVSELYGPEAGGKTSLALSAARTVLESGGYVLIFDLERGLDGGVELKAGKLEGWMEKLGVSPNHPKLTISRPATGEEMYTMIEEAIVNDLYQLIIIDSMAAVIARAELEGDVGESTYGKVAKLNSDTFRRIMVRFDQAKAGNTHLMIINQARDAIGSTYGGIRSTGGRALRHYVSTKLRVSRASTDQKRKKQGINMATIRVDKNKFSPAWETVDVFFHPDFGLDQALEILELGITDGFVRKDGSWYTLYDPDNGEEIFKEQGADKFSASLRARPEMMEKLSSYVMEYGMDKLVRRGQEPE